MKLSAVTGFKRLALAVGALVLGVFGALAVVSFLIPTDQVREAVKSEIRAATGDKVTRVLQIGIGGENMVRFAAITNDLRHYNGRNGMGAVMGSKQVKAIAVRGSGKWIQYARDAQPVLELGRRLAKGVKEHPQSWDLQEKGTPGITERAWVLAPGSQLGPITPDERRQLIANSVVAGVYEKYELTTLFLAVAGGAAVMAIIMAVLVRPMTRLVDAKASP